MNHFFNSKIVLIQDDNRYANEAETPLDARVIATSGSAQWAESEAPPAALPAPPPFPPMCAFKSDKTNTIRQHKWQPVRLHQLWLPRGSAHVI